jgi:UPF0716 protein FxsA
MGLIAAIFVVLPILEVASIVWVAHQVGILATIVALFAVSLCGAVLAKRVGIEVWRRFRATLAAGEVPSREVFDGVLVLIAAACLLVPGFITDVIGLLLLVPAVRSMVKWMFWRRMRRRMVGSAAAIAGLRPPPVRVTAVRVIDETPQPVPPPPPGGYTSP